MRRAMILFAMLFAPLALAADDSKAAERYRLELEMDRHAQSTRWKGVERTYERLLELQVPLSTHAHYVAALSAQASGDVLLTWTRLERAIRHENALAAETTAGQPDPKLSLPESIDISDDNTKAALSAYNDLTSHYGRVSVAVTGNRLPALIRMGQQPFGATERSAISSTQETLVRDKRYVGLLPVGSYMVDGDNFEVTPGELTIVRVK